MQMAGNLSACMGMIDHLEMAHTMEEDQVEVENENENYNNSSIHRNDSSRYNNNFRNSSHFSDRRRNGMESGNGNRSNHPVRSSILQDEIMQRPLRNICVDYARRYVPHSVEKKRKKIRKLKYPLFNSFFNFAVFI